MVLDIYTDGSHKNIRKVKIGAIVVDQNDPNYKEFRYSKNKSVFRIKTEMGIDHGYFKANSSIAEIYSIFSILKQLSHFQRNGNFKIEKINIYTDSMNSFDILNGVSKKVKSNLVRSIAKEIKEISMKFQTVEFMWIKGHSGTWGNEYADKLCKDSKYEINEIYKILPR